MSSINQEIKAIEDELEVIKGKEHAYTLRREQVSRRMESVRDRIESGESTGDRIRDYVIVAYGGLSDHLEKGLSELDQQLKNLSGQLVLVTFQREEPLMHLLIPERGQKTRTVRGFMLGVLNGEELLLDLKSESCMLPSRAFVLSDDLADLVLVEGPLNLGYVKYDSTDEAGDIKAYFFLPVLIHDGPLEIFLGDEAVRESFDSRRGYLHKELFEKAIKLLGWPTNQAADERVGETPKRSREEILDVIFELFVELERSDGLAHGSPLQQHRKFKWEDRMRLTLQEAVDQGIHWGKPEVFQEMCKRYGVKLK